MLQDQPPPVHVAAPQDLEVTEMPLRDQKMLAVFQRLAPPIFSWAIGEDAHEFQLTCQEQLQSLAFWSREDLTLPLISSMGQPGSGGARIESLGLLDLLLYLGVSSQRLSWPDSCHGASETGFVISSLDWSRDL